MKKVLLTFLACLPVVFLSAQNCMADSTYQDTTGVFPMPFDADNPSPDDGINECAIIGENFEFVFTVAVGDSITIPFGGMSQTLALDKIVVVDVQNLPVGINYLCEPTNCTFEDNSLGCVVLTGIPTAANTPMNYELEIKVNVFIKGFAVGIPFTFPDPDLAPGVFSLQLLASANEPCDVAVSTSEELADKVQMTTQPNPTAGPVYVNFQSTVSGEFNLHVMDLFGHAVHREKVTLQQGQNSFSYDGTHLPNGLYLLVLENELGRVAQKMTIQH